MSLRQITVTLTFDPSNCADVDDDTYNLMDDLVEVMGFGIEHYNLSDWAVVEETS